MDYCVRYIINDFVIPAEHTRAAAQALGHKRIGEAVEAHRLAGDFDDDDDFVVDEFLGEKVDYHFQENFCNVIAPYVQSGAVIYACGEDGAWWKHVFKDGKSQEVQSRILFDDGEVYGGA